MKRFYVLILTVLCAISFCACFAIVLDPAVTVTTAESTTTAASSESAGASSDTKATEDTEETEDTENTEETDETTEETETTATATSGSTSASTTATDKPAPTPTDKPKLNKTLTRAIASDGVALSFTGMNFFSACRYDVNQDGTSDLVLQDEKQERSICVAYSDPKTVRISTLSLGNCANTVDYLYSKKSKKFVAVLYSASSGFDGKWHKTFTKNDFDDTAYYEKTYHFKDKPDGTTYISSYSYIYQLNGKSTSKTKYKKYIKSLKLKSIKTVKKANVLKRQTAMSSELISDAAKYLKKDIFGNKISVTFKDINKDKIKDCYFVISGKKTYKGYKGVKFNQDQDSGHKWTDVAVVLQSSSKGIVVKYCKPSEAKKMFK